MTQTGDPHEGGDLTALNRATYDRIAQRYFDQQVRPRAPADELFSDLEDSFVARVHRGAVVADLGCGPGLDAARFVTRGFRVIGLDLSAGMLEVAAERLPGRVVQGDLRALPFEPSQLDGIWCVAALLHVPERDTSHVLVGFRRALRKAGVLALVTALGDGEAYEDVPYATGEGRWFVYRDQDTLLDQIDAAGFHVLEHAEVSGNRQWFTVLAQAR
jgi:SAM-dependent methyltransferase